MSIHFEASKGTLGSGETSYALTKTFGIHFSSANDIVGYSDSNFAGDPERRLSTSGIGFTMSGGPVSWKSQVQKSNALSALEAEYQALSMAAREATWLRLLLQETGFLTDSPILINGDNQG